MANNRERLLFLLKTLMDNTDATHDLTLKDLEAIYKENGISGSEMPSFLVLQALFDFCLLAHAFTQVVKLCPADFTLTNRRHGDDGRRVDREHLFATYTVGNSTNRNRLINAAVLPGNDHTLIGLGTFAVAFFYLDKNTDGIADVHIRQFGLHVLITKCFYKIHNDPFLYYRRS